MLDPDGFAFDAQVPVRPSDADRTGSLSESALVTVLEEARVAWLLSAGDHHRPLITSAMIVTVSLSVERHLRVADGPLWVGMWIAGHRSVDFTIGYAVRAAARRDEVACRATTQMAVVDVAAQTLRRLSDAEKDQLRSWSRPS